MIKKTKKLLIVLLFFAFIFIPVSYASVPIYQLDQPIKELDNYTLREVFQNRNMAMPDLTGKTEISAGVYRLLEQSGFSIDYNISNGEYKIHGTNISPISLTIFNILPNTEYTISYIAVSGTISGGIIIPISAPFMTVIQQINENINKQNTFTTTTQTILRFDIQTGRTFDNYTFKLQLEKGLTATPYQVPTNGPYSDIDVGEFNLTTEQVDYWFNYYELALDYYNNNKKFMSDDGGFINIFKSIYNGLVGENGLMSVMSDVWGFLNQPIYMTELSDYKLFNIDWSWDILGVIRQLISGIGQLALFVIIVVPALLLELFGISLQISLIQLVFTNIVLVILAWIIVKSFVV